MARIRLNRRWTSKYSSSRDAIEYFLTHRKIKQTAVEILGSADNSATRWVEYRYVVDNNSNEARPPKGPLKVGILTNSLTKSGFIDCPFAKEPNETAESGYDVTVVKSLEEALNVRCHRPRRKRRGRKLNPYSPNPLDYFITHRNCYSTEFQFIENLTHLTSGEIDLVICHQDSENLPSEVVQLHPIIKSNLMMVYKPSKLSSTRDIFILTFAGSLWVVFFAIMILLAVCLRISTRRYSRIRPDYQSWSWVEITLWAVAAACQQGLSRTPSGFASCSIFFLGYLMAYLLYTGFTAAITSILVENIDSAVDLKLERLHLISTNCTRSHVRPLGERFMMTEYVNDFDAMFHQLEKADRIGIGPQISLERYISANFDRRNISTYRSVKVCSPFARGFLTAEDNPWRRTIDKNLAAFDESGILRNLLKRSTRPAPTLDPRPAYSSAGREHVASANLLFAGGALVSLLFLASECLVRLYKQGRTHNTVKN